MVSTEGGVKTSGGATAATTSPGTAGTAATAVYGVALSPNLPSGVPSAWNFSIR